MMHGSVNVTVQIFTSAKGIKPPQDGTNTVLPYVQCELFDVGVFRSTFTRPWNLQHV